MKQFNDEFLIPISRQFEDYIRLNIHSMMLIKLKGNNPFINEVRKINKLL